MKRLKRASFVCLSFSCTALGVLILKGCFWEAALYPFAALGLLGCTGMLAAGMYEICLWVKGGARCSPPGTLTGGAEWKKDGSSF